VNDLLQDLRFAARGLRKNPGFTGAAILTLGLGIGANASIFTMVNTLFFKPPAQVERPGELVSVYTSDFSGPRFSTSSWVDYLDFQRGSQEVLAGLASFTPRPFSLAAGEETQRVFGEEVSGNYFDVLGMRPAAGRFLRPAENVVPGTQPVAVIGYGLWQRRFSGRAEAVGSIVHLNGHPFTIVGVAPRDFVGSFRGLKFEIWTPLLMHAVLNAGSQDLTNRGDRGLFLIGRLQPGVTVERARARFAVLARQLHAAYPDNWTDVRHESRAITVLPEREARVFPAVRGPVIGFVGLLTAVVSLVLLICCANVANLLLARASGRRREIAIRLAMGAPRRRLVRQLLTESLLLATLGAGAGLLLATWTTGFLQAFQPPLPLPVALDFSLDGRVLGYTITIAMLAGVVFGLVPAMRATRPDLVRALKDETALTAHGRRRVTMRDALVITQVAVSMVLLVMAGLFLRSLGKAQAADPGFAADGLVLLTTEPSIQGYDSARTAVFYDQLESRVRALPGVTAATLAESVPLGLGMNRRGVQVDGYVPQSGEEMEFGDNTVSAGYFGAMGIPMLKGREFSPVDRPGASPVAIVNEAFARRFWPGQDPIGKRIGQPDAWREVVGVAKDGKYASLGEEPKPYFYLPLAQSYSTDLTLHVRTGNPAALQGDLRVLVHALDSDLPIRMVTMDEHLGLSVLPQRIGATLLGVFGALGLILASVGLYGVLAYSVALRRREIGVRIALGAAAADVRRLVVGQALRLVIAGVVAGLLVAFAAGRLASSFLFGVGAADPLTFAGVPLLLGAVAVLASGLPAHRAARIDPMDALRSE
jgi:macrolide transport system ATP-binding/permease protein